MTLVALGNHYHRIDVLLTSLECLFAPPPPHPPPSPPPMMIMMSMIVMTMTVTMVSYGARDVYDDYDYGDGDPRQNLADVRAPACNPN